MNVESIEMEVLSRNMKKDLFYCFDWDIFDVHYTVVDVDNKKYMRYQVIMNGN